MKAGGSLRCLFWAMLYCVLYLVSASEEDLMDFDFTDLKEIDWNYDNENANNENEMSTTTGNKKYQSNLISFDDYDEDNQSNPFDWRERLLRTALSKALTNAALRQKFIEVMPILRVLSSQQRLALSALISAQINARKGQELKLDQVRMMFGNDRNLLLPIVYDIANMVRNSARNYLTIDTDASLYRSLEPIAIGKRKDEVVADDAAIDEQTKDVGTLPASEMSSSLEDFFDEVQEDVLDAQSINEELQAGVPAVVRPLKTKRKSQAAYKMTLSVGGANNADTNNTQTKIDNLKRARRDLSATDFVHKLIRSVPLTVNQDDLVRGAAGRTMRLNTSSFAAPNEMPRGSSSNTLDTSTISTVIDTIPPATDKYQEIEDLAFANLNGTEVDLQSEAAENREMNEPLPSPAELIAGPRYRLNGNGNGNKAGRPWPKYNAKRKRVQVRPHSKAGSASAPPPAVVAAPKNCERFTASMCIRTEDYPLEQIMGSIRRHKNAMGALLAEYYDKPQDNWDNSDDFDEFPYNKKRREDENTAGGMCQSVVRYARPQKARSASGEWKYIVNTGQHTQTLRLEKCTNQGDSCSYLAHNYRSHCAQVYNYHRLLSWDKSRGLHVDIFKVPTCCSCQVDGYRQQFPPLNSIKSKEYTPAHNADVYSTINEELDYNDEEDDDDLNYQLRNNFKNHAFHKGHGSGGGAAGAGYDANELLLASKKVRTKAYPPSPTVGSYLSPPGSEEYDTNYAYKSQGSRGASQRRPYKSLLNEARVDLEIAPSEVHTEKEVNLFGGTTPANDKTLQRLQQKRKRIYSVPHTATSPVGGSSSSGSGSAFTYSSTNLATVAADVSDAAAGLGSAAHAHQTAVTHHAYYTPSSATAHFISGATGITGSESGNGGLLGVKSKPRFRSPVAAATAGATTATTPTTAAYRPPFAQSTSTVPSAAAALPPIYHVNSIYSDDTVNVLANANVNANSNSIAGAKRINYSYHPIIDFFENNNKRSTPYVTAPAPVTSASVSIVPSTTTSREFLYPHKIPKIHVLADDQSSAYQSRERRIGYGAGAAAVGGDNAWHPVVITS